MKLYIHPNTNDVAFEILKQFYIKEKRWYALKVRWWRISRQRRKILWCTNIEQKFKLPSEKWAEFELFHGNY